MARPGSVGFISQSGALCTAILDWSLKENVGFSAFVSLGSMLDVGWGDLIYHLGDDPNTKSIVIYMETIGDARAFLSAAREVALTKPIIVIKPGRTEAAAKAAASHTGSLTGSDEVLQAAFQRVRRFARGHHFRIVRHGGSARQTAAPERSAPDHRDQRRRPGGARHGHAHRQRRAARRLDAGNDDGSERTLAADLEPQQSGGHHRRCRARNFTRRPWKSRRKIPNTDGLLVILTPQAMTDPTATAEALKAFAHIENKPIIASWMGVGQVEKGEDILNAADIPTFKYPDRAARAFYYMWRYSENLRSLYETPASTDESNRKEMDRGAAGKIIADVRKAGRTILTEFESKQLLAAYGIPTVETHIALTENEAVKQAAHLGFPVVLKLYSETITHKTDVGGVQLNLRTASAVRQAWKAIETAVHQKSRQGTFPRRHRAADDQAGRL